MGPYLTLLILPAMLAYYVYMRRLGARHMAKADRDNAHARLGEMAQRFGLRILEGDPSANLTTLPMERQQQVSMAGSAFGGQTQREIRVHLAGEVHGRPLEIVYHDRVEFESSFLDGQTVTEQVRSRVAIRPRVSY